MVLKVTSIADIKLGCFHAMARACNAELAPVGGHGRLQPMIEMAKMLKSRLPNLLTYLKHPITNATSESLNAKIQ
jgi:hypothetical protein